MYERREVKLGWKWCLQRSRTWRRVTENHYQQINLKNDVKKNIAWWRQFRHFLSILLLYSFTRLIAKFKGYLLASNSQKINVTSILATVSSKKSEFYVNSFIRKSKKIVKIERCFCKRHLTIIRQEVCNELKVQKVNLFNHYSALLIASFPFVFKDFKFLVSENEKMTCLDWFSSFVFNAPYFCVTLS